MIRNKEKIYIAAAILTVAALEWMGPGCPIRFFFGISCAGCGMTRAALSLLSLDFESAYYYHPLVFLMPAAAAAFLFKEKIPQKLISAGCLFLVLAFLFVYIIRLFDASCDIVVFRPETGLLFKILSRISKPA